MPSSRKKNKNKKSGKLPQVYNEDTNHHHPLALSSPSRRPPIAQNAVSQLIHTTHGVSQEALEQSNGAAQGVTPLHSENELSSTLFQHLQNILQNGSVPTQMHGTIPSEGGFFSNAHDFNVSNVNMYNISDAGGGRGTEEERQAEEERQVRRALDILKSEAMPGAMLNSLERAEAPRCNEGTRVTLRGLVVEWGRNLEELQRLFWLFGPAAVGKSAVAQSVAEELREEGNLAAVFFFSRPNNRSDPNVVIPTLAFQLALLLRPYKLIFAQQLIEDPLILTRDRPSQFNAFITDPFLTSLSQRPLNLLYKQLLDAVDNRPLTIILDGLDECHGRDAQCEFVRMISDYVQKDTNSRLRWMICSRPESHLQVAFSSSSCQVICRQEKLEIDHDEAREDAGHILNAGFAQIRETYPDQLDDDWPTESQTHFIARRASGHLGFVSFVIRFIGDSYYGDPSGRLDICIRFLEGVHRPEDLNPLHALDLLYTQILSDIPQDILPITSRILGFILYYNERLTAVALANILNLDRSAFYRALERLHSVLSVPRAKLARDKSIQIYHASFSDYLKDPMRAKQFFLDEGAVHLNVALRGLEGLRLYRRNTLAKVPQELSWIPTPSIRQTLLDSVCSFLSTHCWKAMSKVPRKYISTLQAAFKRVDFDLLYSKWEVGTQGFAYFLLELLSSDAKSLVPIDFWSTDPGMSVEEGEVVVPLSDRNPHAIIKSFLQVRDPAHSYSIHLRLMTCTPTAVCLIIEHDDFCNWYLAMEGIKGLQEDDIVIGVMGPNATGVCDFLETLTGQNDLPTEEISRRIFISRINHHPVYGSRVVLVGIPSFGEVATRDVLISLWLESTYRMGIRLSGIIYLHPITDDITDETSLRNLHMLGSICGDRAAPHVMFMSIMWDEVDPAVGEEREAELQWLCKGFLDAGSGIDRLRRTSEEDSWRIVRRLIDAAKCIEALLLQEEIVDLERKLSETETSKMLRSYLQKLLEKQKRKLISLCIQKEQSAPWSKKRDLVMQYERTWDQFKTTLREALEVSIEQQTVVPSSSREPLSKPIMIPDLRAEDDDHVFPTPELSCLRRLFERIQRLEILNRRVQGAL